MKREREHAERSGGEPRGFDWNRFERLFDELFPRPYADESLSLSRIGDFVRSAIDRAVPDAGRMFRPSDSASISAPLFKPELSETKRHVFVRIRIPASVNPRKLQLFVGESLLKIEGPLGRKQTIVLPAPVNPKVCKAAFRDGTLHIRMRKSRGGKFRELFIRFP